jgi:6-pyruvoyltetrahydropterin/6-carboxytetrahydropterin synthase
MSEIKARRMSNQKLPHYIKRVPVLLTKEFTFDAAHHLEPYEGKCAYAHGHTYKLQVTVKGVPNDTTGLLIDFNKLKEVVNQHLDKLDHNYLNEFFTFTTSCENMIKWLWAVLDEEFVKRYIACDLYELKLWETPTSFCTINRQLVEEV